MTEEAPMASLEERLEVASSFILQAPPGEVNDVFNDVRPIVGDDGELENGLLPALEQYNIQQLALVELPNSKIPAIICPAAQVNRTTDKNRYYDPRSLQSFTFDHLRLCAIDVQNYDKLEDNKFEKIRLELDGELEKYVKDRFPGGVWTVFGVNPFSSNDQSQQSPGSVHQPEVDDDDEKESNLDEENKENEPIPEIEPKQIEQSVADDEQLSTGADTQPIDSKAKFQLYVVSNKYNPTNYWTGRWRSMYEIDLDSNKIQGQILVNVHYYEQGNVQSTLKHSPLIEIEPDTTSKQIIKSIEKLETEFQKKINLNYLDLSDSTFKQLRRALPVTKQKMNWNNINSRIVLNDK